jgi:hypothetical protein
VPVSAGNTLIEVPVELWLYNFGPSQLMRRVRFESGRVVAIEILATATLSMAVDVIAAPCNSFG